MVKLLQLLKDNTIITDFIIHVSRHKRVIENPHFFGEVNPSLDNLLDLCDIPDTSFGHHDTDWNECDIRVLPYLRMGYKNVKLIDRDEIELYQIRSPPDRRCLFAQPPEFEYFDFDEQTLHYPNQLYEEKIREKLERDNF